MKVSGGVMPSSYLGTFLVLLFAASAAIASPANLVEEGSADSTSSSLLVSPVMKRHDGGTADKRLLRQENIYIINDDNKKYKDTFVSVSLSKDMPGNYLAVGYNNPARVEVWERTQPTEPWQKRPNSTYAINGGASSYKTHVSLSDDGNLLAVAAGVSPAGDLNTAQGKVGGKVIVYQWLGPPKNMYEKIFERTPSIYTSFKTSKDISVVLSGDGERLAFGPSAGGVYVYNLKQTSSEDMIVSFQIEGTGGLPLALAKNNQQRYSLSFAKAAEVVIGSTGNAASGDNGYVRVYKLDGTTNQWRKRGDDLDKGNNQTYNSISVAISSLYDIAGYGVSFKDATSGRNTTQYRAFDFNGTEWNQYGKDLSGYGPNDKNETSISFNTDGSIFAICEGGSEVIAINKFLAGGWRTVANVSAYYKDGEDESTPDNNRQSTYSVGTTISLNDFGNTVGIGSPYINPTEPGFVRIAEKNATAPNRPITPPSVGVGGDPHFRASNGQVFSYHGECDLVLMSSNDHASAFLGIDVHVRTTRIDNPSMSFSYISSAAVKIGEEVMEVSENDDVFFNKGDKFTNFDAKSTTSFAGYTLTQSFKGRKRNIVVYSLDLLGDGRSIEIRVNKNVGMVYVDINGYYDDSTGLVGASEQAGLLLSRDGAVDLAGQWNTLGEEWQVRNTEPKLFRENRAPQYPVGCIYEQFARKNNVRGASKQANRRRLMDINVVSREDAIKACSKSTVHFMEYCVDDVMVSGDVEVAEDSFYQ